MKKGGNAFRATREQPLSRASMRSISRRFRGVKGGSLDDSADCPRDQVS